MPALGARRPGAQFWPLATIGQRKNRAVSGGTALAPIGRGRGPTGILDHFLGGDLAISSVLARRLAPVCKYDAMTTNGDVSPAPNVGTGIETNPFVRALERIMRDGRPKALDAAVTELCEIVSDRSKVEQAAALIREKARQVHEAQEPKSVIGPGIETWYSGPRAEDHYWPRLVELLRADGWDGDRIGDLDDASSKVVAYLPNPAGSGTYHCKGLVLGYVQSGKTTNFTAVAAKAADVGYRFIIVLSGMHDALRQQTQDRLNQQLWALHPDRWNRLTNDIDFQPTANVDALLANSSQRVLAIVKKNASRLRALRGWLAEAQPRLLAECPILIIDDEADQATVNTAKPDAQPKAINRLIRQLVNDSPRSAYVGYTATPFANVLIDPQDYEDLYPRDFIVDLPRPASYLGPEVIFGREPLEHDSDVVDDGHDLIRTVLDEEIQDLRPVGTAARHGFAPDMTDSLDEAMRYFLLSTAARRIRHQGIQHATALVHTSQHIAVHETTAELLISYFQSVANRLASGEGQLLDRLRTQWERETVRVPASHFGLSAVAWDDIAAALPALAAEVAVITDNSRSLERLDFDAANPRVIVAVGGNTLSRGLTLEGLAVSFFVRSASAYDTVLQMGRWFGYRDGYVDLTRIWLTHEMQEWFRHLATVEQEIRYDIARYESAHLTPEQLGVRVRTHPQLAVTAASKMRKAQQANVSYSGRRLQTILFNHRDLEWLQDNIGATRGLLTDCANAVVTTGRKGVKIIGPVDSTLITDFISAYRFHPNSRELNSALINRYIVARNADDELTTFNIAVMSRQPAMADLGSIDLPVVGDVGCISRARLRTGDPTYADIKALMSPTDRTIDLEVTAAEIAAMDEREIAALRNPPNRGRGDGGGLLLLYPISQNSRPTEASQRLREPLNAVLDIIGVGLVFPESLSAKAQVDYLTADVASMPGVEVEEPDEDDLSPDGTEDR